MSVLPDGASDTELYIACPACVSFVSIDSREDKTGTIDSHNERSHDGDDIARVLNTRDMGELTAFLQDVKEHASGDQYDNLINRMRNGNSTFFCSASIFEATVPKDDRY